MKRVLLLLLLFTSSLINAQNEVEKFEITPDGLNGYVVLEFQGMSKEEIFGQLQKWAEYNIRDAERSNYSEIKNEYLTYSVRFPRAIQYKNFMGKSAWDITMDAEYRIKKERLRIDFVNVRIPGSGPEMELEIRRGGMTALYKKNGELKKNYTELVNQFNLLINEILSEIKKSVASNPDVVDPDW